MQLLIMKNLSENNFPEGQCGSTQESSTDTNSFSDDDEDAGVRELKRTIAMTRSKMSDLEGRLKDTEIDLAVQKDKIALYEVIVKDKDNVNKLLQHSIDLTNEMKQMQNAINESAKHNYTVFTLGAQQLKRPKVA